MSHLDLVRSRLSENTAEIVHSEIRTMNGISTRTALVRVAPAGSAAWHPAVLDMSSTWYVVHDIWDARLEEPEVGLGDAHSDAVRISIYEAWALTSLLARGRDPHGVPGLRAPWRPSGASVN